MAGPIFQTNPFDRKRLVGDGTIVSAHHIRGQALI